MLAISCLCVVCMAIITSGQVLRKYRKTKNVTCFTMLLMMTASVVIGMGVATLIPNMVLGTIIAIMVSGVNCIILTYRLHVTVVFESIGALFMGAMMGVMFQLMVSSYTILGFLFFMSLMLMSMLALFVWIAKEENVQLRMLFSKRMLVTSLTSVAIVALILTVIPAIKNVHVNSDQQLEHHMHHE